MDARRGPLNVGAVIAALLTPVVIALALMLDAREEPDQEFREIALPFIGFFMTSLPFIGFFMTCTVLMICFAIYQWDVQKNRAFSKNQRIAWTLGLFALPFSILAYWWFHVRQRD